MPRSIPCRGSEGNGVLSTDWSLIFFERKVMKKRAIWSVDGGCGWLKREDMDREWLTYKKIGHISTIVRGSTRGCGRGGVWQKNRKKQNKTNK